MNSGSSRIFTFFYKIFSLVFFLLPPITKYWPKLDLGATAPPYDGNHSTCGYLGVIWTPWRDFNSQIGLIPLSLCRKRRSKKVTHFRLYGNVRTWHGQIQELKGGFNRGYGGHWAADGKPNSPPSLPYTTATMRVHAGHDSAPEPKITIIPSFLLREWKLLLFCLRYYFFESYSFFLGIDIFFDERWRAFQKYQLFY